MELKDKKVLLITPFFYNYGQYICNEIASNGASVDLINYDLITYKRSFLKIIPGSINIIDNFYLKKIVDKKCKYKRYDLIIVIRGGNIKESTIKKLIEKYSEGDTIIYLWDSIKENPNVIKILPYFSKVVSFDPNDCSVYKFKYLPLFYTENFEIKELDNHAIEYDLAFVGLDHSDRFEILSKIKKQAEINNLKIKVYLVTSKLGFVKRKIFNRKVFRNATHNDFCFKSIPFSEISKIYRTTRCIIDIEQKIQSGLTIRTFELLAMGKKMVTTNRNIQNSDIYSSEYISIIDRENPILDISFLKENLTTKPDVKRYSLKSWVSNLLEK